MTESILLFDAAKFSPENEGAFIQITGFVTIITGMRSGTVIALWESVHLMSKK